ncbi:MAG: NPCBM/NEW2 domain-containing protein, partial [Lentisphaerae bacterium]|nr:NPCBM/NEW2 domain-containing protein [Lentisphaerota bacterium]
MNSNDPVAVKAEEMAEEEAWFNAAFMGVAAEDSHPEPHLVVIANHWGMISQNRNALERPLNIAGREYAGGLNCHAVSLVSVRLPAPAMTFSAVVGVDSNPEWTIPGNGNLVFTVKDGEKDLWHSPVMREGMAGVPVSVPLRGAREFLLEIRDGGEGIDFGQGDWAEARVTLEDGREVWLGDVACSTDAMKRPHGVGWPFSFLYDGKPSLELLAAWPLEQRERKLDESRTEHTLTWTDPATRLQVRCTAVRYRDFPTAEWTVYFKNTGTEPTPILEKVLSIDARLERRPGGEFLLHHAVGSPCTPGDYGPMQTTLPKGATKHIATSGGRGSNSDWPYFNLEAVGEGTILAVGWPGQWAADFVRDEANGVQVRAGQETTHFSLLPGEEVRTPLMAVQFWEGGDWIRAQNIWRRWMIAHNLPRPGGKLPAPMLLGYTGRFHEEMAKATEENQTACFHRYREEELKLDFWWIDAGWYPIKGNWTTTGTWEVDRTRFPRGLKAISDLAHSHDMKLLTWFEPERVTKDTW